MCAAARRKNKRSTDTTIGADDAIPDDVVRALENLIDVIKKAKPGGVRLPRRKTPQSGETASRAADAPQQPQEEAETPHWDAQTRELWFRGTLLMRFDHGAADQELILTSFQELHWIRRIPDPLSPYPGSNRQHRRRNAILKLNNRQQHRLIRFRGDGTGKGICWEPVDEP
jgi:hypothetical protein